MKALRCTAIFLGLKVSEIWSVIRFILESILLASLLFLFQLPKEILKDLPKVLGRIIKETTRTTCILLDIGCVQTTIFFFCIYHTNPTNFQVVPDAYLVNTILVIALVFYTIIFVGLCAAANKAVLFIFRHIRNWIMNNVEKTKVIYAEKYE